MPSGQNMPFVHAILAKAKITKGPPSYKLFAWLVFCMEKVLRELHGDSGTGQDELSVYETRFTNGPPVESRMFSTPETSDSKKRTLIITTR